ncbi:NAD(P)/FAD-dependent oxidoreductase [Glutamicibacter sp. HZAU]|uniref:NAD(P)/FAD-dependent oxidoreductase n=1 Tax=Glutamicibacter sp. HZAU TaxID=2049891 RepID=UPI000FFCA0E6|nr:NAD(P)/FAD-dependent oxidoreductase [Glutamicibacter sp. HZAU]RWZ79786.1 NAD(P)/FAD-dependent oxidoreductase [Glutamicibacter sp. HZAU]
MEHFETIVIGGGSAGLAAAIALGRSRRTVLVIDEGQPRNEAAQHAHNVLGNEGINPLELLSRGRQEAISYGVQIIEGAVDRLTGSLDTGFRVTASGQSFSAGRIVLATGLVDDLPAIPGLDRAWGDTAAHCAYCHGWEVRDQEILVLGLGPMSTHQAMMFSQLSPNITFINHNPSALNDENRATLAALGIPVIEQSVQEIEFDAQGDLDSVKLADGRNVSAQALVVASKMNAQASLYLSLGGQLAEHPLGTFIQVDDMGATALPGVYAAGNASNLGAMVMAAAASGTIAGAAINADLLGKQLAKVQAQA